MAMSGDSQRASSNPQLSLDADGRRPGAITPLNSLPGAPNSIYLIFDGHVEPKWRTDWDQNYENIKAGAANLTDAEIRTVWESVAEDFAPFNVNVTTVRPPTSANVLRVVIAGSVTADYVVPPVVAGGGPRDASGRTIVKLSGNTFLTKDFGVTLTTKSGLSKSNSFAGNGPEVVFVFANLLRAWKSASPEGDARTLAMTIANTASHEAGHAFGLEHHTGVDETGKPSEYHVGDRLTTPIMGSNAAGDRTLWSTYTDDSGETCDAIQRLTNVLGARPDDYANSLEFARRLTFSPDDHFPGQSSVSGVIETTTDSDWFSFSTLGAGFKFDLRTAEYANLDARLELYRVASTPQGLSASLVASDDEAPVDGAPFSGLGASISANLAAGDYAVAVKSHGHYGDLGFYTLHVTQDVRRTALANRVVDAASNRSNSAPMVGESQLSAA
jgi:hypothetical protein